jgi:hypothetical protein
LPSQAPVCHCQKFGIDNPTARLHAPRQAEDKEEKEEGKEENLEQ